ncbi:unnamed protein product [Albugo candida]|uniref:FMN hydroxy acid dehydrogenase domain-containing protein n=1 Tax=Albugo candida TaxID=65357 RepID=A0A024G390_9STRA|nr:unnamed protein product [Albugo candida]|eukprot:CCI41131.1 unnamed protein product [Albugo candida]
MKSVPGSDTKPINARDYEEFAREFLPKKAYDYYATGADDMITLKENQDAFQRIKLRPRVLRDVSDMQMRTSLLGSEVDTPISIAPTAMHCMAHYDGELATARAAARMNTCMILSTLSTKSIEDVADASGNGLRWFQLYVFKNRDLTLSLVQRAEKAGFKAIVLTVDTPVFGQREADVRNRFSLPHHLKLANFMDAKREYAHVQSSDGSGVAEYVSAFFDPAICWDDVKWLKRNTSLPLVIKGILTAEDALMVAEIGCEAIIVSNHGARQLDGVLASIEALPEVVKAVRGKNIEVYVDGGVRRGTDIFKALALGARAVFLGRPILWGLSHDGEDGAFKMLRLLTDELKTAMTFCGTRRISDISVQYAGENRLALNSLLTCSEKQGSAIIRYWNEYLVGEARCKTSSILLYALDRIQGFNPFFMPTDNTIP